MSIVHKKELYAHAVKILLALLVVAFLLILLEKFNNWYFVQAPTELKQYFESLSTFSIPLFIVLYVLCNVFLMPSYPLVFAAGIIYGFFYGSLISLVAEVLAATINFYLGRKFGKAFFLRKSKNELIEKVKDYIDTHGFSVILLLRYLGFYFDIVSYASGATKIKYKGYILATTIGFIPYILIYAYAGNLLLNIKSSSFIYTILFAKTALFGFFFIGYFVYTRMKKTPS